MCDRVTEEEEDEPDMFTAEDLWKGQEKFQDFNDDNIPFMDLFEGWVDADTTEDVTAPLSDSDIIEEEEPVDEEEPPAMSDCLITSSSIPSALDFVKMLQTSLHYFETKNLDPLHILPLKSCIRSVKEEEKKSKRQTTLTQYFKKI